MSSYEFQDGSYSANKRPYHRIQPQEKQELIKLVFQNGLSISKAAQNLGINNSTAKVVIRKYKTGLKTTKSKKQRQTLVENPQNSKDIQAIQIQSDHEQPTFIFFYPNNDLFVWNLANYQALGQGFYPSF